MRCVLRSGYSHSGAHQGKSPEEYVRISQAPPLDTKLCIISNNTRKQTQLNMNYSNIRQTGQLGNETDKQRDRETERQTDSLTEKQTKQIKQKKQT